MPRQPRAFNQSESRGLVRSEWPLEGKAKSRSRPVAAAAASATASASHSGSSAALVAGAYGT